MTSLSNEPLAPPSSPYRATYRGLRLFGLALLAVLVMLPVTMPVPVLRGLVQERFAVSELATSLFMSINMIGALFAAPLAGAVVDRYGRAKQLLMGALLLDALLIYSLTLDLSFGVFLGLRFCEGCAHIVGVSLVLAIAASTPEGAGRGRVLGAVGGGITLGVALGVPLGGVLGNEDPLQPLRAGTLVLVAAILLAQVVLRTVALTANRRSLGALVRSVLTDRALAVPFAFAFCDRFTVGFFTTTFPLYLKRTFDLPPARIGLLLALFLVPFSLLSFPCGRLSERVSRTALVSVGSFLYGASVISLTAWPESGLPVLMVLLGLTSAVMYVPSMLLVSNLVAPEAKSTALGGFNAAGSLGFLLGPLVGGALTQWIAARASWDAGYSAAFAVAGGAEILCVLATLPLLLRLRRAGRIT